MAQNFIVNKGLGAGDRVIVAGVQKVQPGEVVNPIPAPVAAQQNGSQATAQAGQGD
jgi:membrane fusion protein (multidrug efflux system)